MNNATTQLLLNMSEDKRPITKEDKMHPDVGAAVKGEALAQQSGWTPACPRPAAGISVATQAPVAGLPGRTKPAAPHSALPNLAHRKPQRKPLPTFPRGTVLTRGHVLPEE